MTTVTGAALAVCLGVGLPAGSAIQSAVAADQDTATAPQPRELRDTVPAKKYVPPVAPEYRPDTADRPPTLSDQAPKKIIPLPPGEPIDVEMSAGAPDMEHLVKLVPKAPCPLDLDFDREIGFGDMLIVLNAWGLCRFGEPCPADVTGNGVVNMEDLFEICCWYGLTCDEVAGAG
jgi:hypothetical protein